jgi:hypothetical protein
MSAKTPADMLHRVSTRAGRLLQWDAPPEATNFYDATASAAIPFETAQQLLIAYMRLRSPITKAQEPDPYAVVTDGSGESDIDTAAATQETQDDSTSQAAA